MNRRVCMGVLCTDRSECARVGADLVLVQNQGGMASAGVGYTSPLQQPGNISAFRRQAETGELLPTGAVTEVEHAMFVAFLPPLDQLATL